MGMGNVKTDIQIAQENDMLPIIDIANQIGLKQADLNLYGNYKAKINWDAVDKLRDNKSGKLVLVTAISPTPAGEG